MHCTEGHWWSPDGFVAARCRHTASVHALEQVALAGDAPRFLPAPVDLHVHGGGGCDVMQGDAALRQVLATHAEHGCGALLATSVTAPFDDIDAFLASVQRVMAAPDPGSATLLGAHLEGPFISPDKLGAQPPFAVPVDGASLERWCASGIVKVITWAPEIDVDDRLLRVCERYGVRAQLGHTLCDWACAARALARGCGVTHLYNAMSGVASRDGGAATAALAFAQFAEIITDGVHVDHAAFQAARRAVPQLYSVTDATAAAGMPDGRYTLGSLTVERRGERVLLPDGTLAGSCLTQQRSMRVLRGWQLSWADIARLSSERPARWVGETSLGRIAPGARAHWIEIRGERPVALWLDGERQPFAETV